MIELELFISGRSVNSVIMIQRVQQVVALLEQQQVRVKLTLQDVLEEPQRALEVGVMLTPVLIRWQPSDPKMIVGVSTEDDILALVQSALA